MFLKVHIAKVIVDSAHNIFWVSLESWRSKFTNIGSDSKACFINFQILLLLSKFFHLSFKMVLAIASNKLLVASKLVLGLEFKFSSISVIYGIKPAHLLFHSIAFFKFSIIKQI